MKKIVFKCADDALFNVSRAADAEYIIEQLKESIKSLEGWCTISAMLADTTKVLTDMDMSISRMYVKDESIILFIEAPEWFFDTYKFKLYDHIRENLEEINDNFSRAIDYYSI